MLDEYDEIEESELPKLNDPKMDELAEEMGDELQKYRDIRRSLEEDIWPECDKGFHAIKEPLPISAVRFVDNGMLGDSTLREAIKVRRNQIIAAVMPPDESWLEMASLDEEDTEDQLRRSKEHNISMHNKADTKGAMEPVVDQLLIRGATAIGWMWKKRCRINRIPRQLEDTITALSVDLAGREPTKKELKDIVTRKTYFDGPIVFPVDLYRLWWDPTVDLQLTDDLPMVYLFFKTAAELKGAKDEFTKEDLYDHDALADVREWSYAEFYKEYPSALTSTQIMGLNPAVDTEERFIPIYLFHRQVRETDDGEIYIDKFFYVARGSADTEWKIIRVQDNPSLDGHRPFFFTVCDRWMNLPYGSGLVEKSLSTYKATNILKNMSLTGHVMNVIPPTSHVGNVAKNGQPPNWMPGRSTEIIWRPGIGLDWIKAHPVNPNNLAMSMSEIRSLREDMVAQTGTSSAAMTTDRNKSTSSGRTATEIRQEAAEGGVTDIILVDKVASDLVQPIAQAIYDCSRQKNAGAGVKYTLRTQTGQLRTGQLSGEELNRERAVEIVGRRGIAGKAQEINNLLEVIDVLTKGNAAQVLPNVGLILHDVIIQLITRLGVVMKDEYKMTPVEITANDPRAQLQMLQAALQTEEGQQLAIEILMKQPEVVEQLQQLVDQARQQGAQMAQKPAQKPTGG